MATPLAFAAYGGALSERSGVFNVALEGALLSGAFAAALGAACFGSTSAGFFELIRRGTFDSRALFFDGYTGRKPIRKRNCSHNMLCAWTNRLFRKSAGGSV